MSFVICNPEFNINSPQIIVREFYSRTYMGEIGAIYEGEEVFIDRVAIPKRFIDNGVGTEILNKLEELCISKGVKCIYSNLSEENLELSFLFDFLKENGFSLVHSSFQNEKRIRMEKIL